MPDGQPINDPNYWKERLRRAPPDAMHKAVFVTGRKTWEAIEDAHRKILERLVLPNESVLDCGCGWGRLLDLMPDSWGGEYVGVDLSPDFVDIARENNRDRTFHVGRIEDVVPRLHLYEKFDWAVFVSIRPMVKRNLGEEVWRRIETAVRGKAERLLYLEYDPADPGSVE